MADILKARQPKFTDEVLDHEFDLSPWLTEGETVVDVEAEGTHGLTVDGIDISRMATDAIVIVRLSGGQDTPQAMLSLLAQLSDGEKPGLALMMRVIER